ncbi:MAG: hypothetical protein ABJN69_10740 [Hellea sp.]
MKIVITDKSLTRGRELLLLLSNSQRENFFLGQHGFRKLNNKELHHLDKEEKVAIKQKAIDLALVHFIDKEIWEASNLEANNIYYYTGGSDYRRKNFLQRPIKKDSVSTYELEEFLNFINSSPNSVALPELLKPDSQVLEQLSSLFILLQSYLISYANSGGIIGEELERVLTSIGWSAATTSYSKQSSLVISGKAQWWKNALSSESSIFHSKQSSLDLPASKNFVANVYLPKNEEISLTQAIEAYTEIEELLSKIS